MARHFNPKGRELRGPSAFQRTHRPTATVRIRCHGELVEDRHGDHVCLSCGRILTSVAASHVPEISMGRVNLYSDGSLAIDAATPDELESISKWGKRQVALFCEPVEK